MKFNFLLCFLLLNSCQLPPPTAQRKEELISFSEVIIDTNPLTQSKFQQEWMTNISKYTRENSYDYIADIWGGGALKLHLWFDQNGALWDSMIDVDNLPYILHPLVSKYEKKFENSAFIDGKTAVVVMPWSASFKLAGNLYVLRVSNNTIYRTHGSLTGFHHANRWDGKTIPNHYLVNLKYSANQPDKNPIIPRPEDTNDTSVFTMQQINYSPEVQKQFEDSWNQKINNFPLNNYEATIAYQNGTSTKSFTGFIDNSIMYRDSRDSGKDKYLFKKQILSNHSYPIFLDEQTAVMVQYTQASSFENINHANQARIYTIKISNDGIIYRTADAGFGDWDSWTGEKAAVDKLVPFITSKNNVEHSDWVNIDLAKQKEYAERFLQSAVFDNIFSIWGKFNADIIGTDGKIMTNKKIRFDYQFCFDPSSHPINKYPLIQYKDDKSTVQRLHDKSDGTKIFYLDGKTAVMAVYGKPYTEYPHGNIGHVYTIRISNNIVYRTSGNGFADYSTWNQQSAPTNNLEPFFKIIN
ncbi:MAG: hypothetical protein ACRCTQ_05040 [Brevinemataceae bacterium]